MNNETSNEALAFTGQLQLLLKRSASAYRDYLQNGKTFLYARILRLYNEETRRLLLEKSWLLDNGLQDDALALVAHYDVWMQKWDDLAHTLQPRPDDVFVFPNSTTFPRESAGRLEEAFKNIKSNFHAG